MTIQKKDGIAKPTKANVALEDAYRCGECLHFKQSKHHSFDDVCSKLGRRPFAIAPTCYTPDYSKVIANTDEFVQMVSLFGDKTPQQKRIILAILKAEPKGKKLRMGTKMYLNYRGREYISNYLCGYVVGYTSGGEVVLCGTPERGTRGRSFFAYLRGDESLITPKEWKERFLSLRASGRIQDPKAVAVRDITAKVQDDNYEVPTIDNAPRDPNEKKGKKGETRDLRRVPLTQILTF